MDDYGFPWYTNVWKIILIFLISLAFFHYFLIKKYRLNSLGWKRVDYIWVSFALIGVLVGAAETRYLFVSNYAQLATSRSEVAFDRVLDSVRFGTSGAVCRTFLPSEYIPSDDRQKVQLEFDAQCEWFKKLAPIMAKQSPIQRIDLSGLLPTHPEGGDRFAYDNFINSVEVLNKSINDQAFLKTVAKDEQLKDFKGFGWWILAIVIALRLTKVTGEVKLEQERKNIS